MCNLKLFNYNRSCFYLNQMIKFDNNNNLVLAIARFLLEPMCPKA